MQPSITQTIGTGHQAEIPISGGTVKLYLDDSELNRDSAILIKADGQAFLNLNDCRITDALPVIRRDEGAIDVLAMQFSGANWHPVCYDYPPDRYAAVSRKKVLAKFHSVVRAIKTTAPRFYLASAGPPWMRVSMGRCLTSRWPGG